MEVDWTARPDLTWCVSCGANAQIETQRRALGLRYVCKGCGRQGWMQDDDAPTVDNVHTSKPRKDNQ